MGHGAGRLPSDPSEREARTDITRTPAETGVGGRREISDVVDVRVNLPNRAKAAIDAKHAGLTVSSTLPGRRRVGTPGSPVGGLISGPNLGFHQKYEDRAIYWQPGIGAYWVHGGIYDRYVALGAESGFLRYPITDGRGTSDGEGRYSDFQGARFTAARVPTPLRCTVPFATFGANLEQRRVTSDIRRRTRGRSPKARSPAVLNGAISG